MHLPKLILFLILLIPVREALAQNMSAPVQRWVDSINKTFQDIIELKSQIHFADQINDSTIKEKLVGKIKIDTPRIHRPSVTLPRLKLSKPTKPIVDFTGGFVNYNWSYRSSIDTPFHERNLSQHFISANLNFTIARTVPITVNYFDRQSNSKYFRDYRDIRIDFNTAEFSRLQSQKLFAYTEQITDQLRNPITKPSLDVINQELEKIENWKLQREVQNMFLSAGRTIVNGGSVDTVNRRLDTSTLSKAKEFVAMYKAIDQKTEKLKAYRDTLRTEYVKVEKEIASIKKMLTGNASGIDKRESIESILLKHGIKDKRLSRLYAAASSIKALAVGKTVPNYSELSVKNINVNGINFEYNRKLYFAFTAGTIDYRARDFFYSKVKRRPQFVYAARLGYGRKEGSHFFLTGYKGKKQVLSSTQAPSVGIYGLSFESQLVVNNNHKLIGEIAQSVAPDLINSNGPTEKPKLDLADQNNRAYSIKLNSYFPKTRSRIEAFYKYRGINYQNFSSYYTNAALDQWSVKGDQYLFKRILRITASVAKNNYENPYLLIRYSGNTVFKNLIATFKKPKLPTLSVAYMPSSQLSQIDGQVYENFYHTLNVNVNHQYKVGLAQALSLLSFNKFYNDVRDTGFLYYDARNYYFNQHFQFLSYTTDINIAQTKSRDYTLTVLEAGASAKIWKQSVIGFGVKISQLNNQSVKVGLYGSQKIVIPKLGEINTWIEKSYLPAWGGGLVKTEFYNIGFFRVIN